jgi:hypothetical protein
MALRRAIRPRARLAAQPGPAPAGPPRRMTMRAIACGVAALALAAFPPGVVAAAPHRQGAAATGPRAPNSPRTAPFPVILLAAVAAGMTATSLRRRGRRTMPRRGRGGARG